MHDGVSSSRMARFEVEFCFPRRANGVDAVYCEWLEPSETVEHS